MTVINIRGTNGAGKTHLVRAVFDRATAVEPVLDITGVAEAYRLSMPLLQPIYVLGPYDTPTGGCDAVHPYDAVLDLLNKYEPRGHVLFEGVLISTCWGRVGEWLEQHDACVVFLNTPLEVCITNVLARRSARHQKLPLTNPLFDDPKAPVDTDEFDPKLLTNKFQYLEKLQVRLLLESKVQAVSLDSGAVDRLLGLFT